MPATRASESRDDHDEQAKQARVLGHDLQADWCHRHGGIVGLGHNKIPGAGVVVTGSIERLSEDG